MSPARDVSQNILLNSRAADPGFMSWAFPTAAGPRLKVKKINSTDGLRAIYAIVKYKLKGRQT